METVSVFALYSVAALNATVPGPCTILTAARSALAGRGAGVRVTLGVVMAKTILLTSSLTVMFGAVTLSDGAFEVMRWVGIALLVAMAAHLLSSRPGGRGDQPRAAVDVPDVAAGLMAGVSSPYNLVLLLALLPQFLPAQLGAAAILPVVGAVVSGCVTGQIAAIVVGPCSRRLFSTRVL